MPSTTRGHTTLDQQQRWPLLLFLKAIVAPNSLFHLQEVDYFAPKACGKIKRQTSPLQLLGRTTPSVASFLYCNRSGTSVCKGDFSMGQLIAVVVYAACCYNACLPTNRAQLIRVLIDLPTIWSVEHKIATSMTLALPKK